MIKLRPYQATDVEKIRYAYREGRKSVLYVAPTGSGKTILFAYITHAAMQRHHVVMILAHRVELIDQISKALTEFGVPHGFIANGYEYRRHLPVYVCSVFTVAKRLDWISPSLIIIDEAHHAVASTTWGKILSAFPQAHRLGVTATPIRTSGEGLGEFFEIMICGPTYTELRENGALVPLRVFAPPIANTKNLHVRAGEFMKGEMISLMDRPSITGTALQHYNTITPGLQTVVFCVSVEHAKHVAQDFRSAEIKAENVDGGFDRQIRNATIRAFTRGDVRVLTSCDLISEGFDCPRIEAGISLRPTHSLGLWRQQGGRLVRPYPEKSTSFLLDAAGNTLRHGLPTDDMPWSLAGDGGAAERAKSSGGVRVCSKCFSAQSARKPKCGNCGEAFPVESRTVAEKKGSLEEMTSEQLAAYRRDIETGRTKSLEALIHLGRIRGYNNPEGWAKHVYDARNIKRKRA